MRPTLARSTAEAIEAALRDGSGGRFPLIMARDLLALDRAERSFEETRVEEVRRAWRALAEHDAADAADATDLTELQEAVAAERGPTRELLDLHERELAIRIELLEAMRASMRNEAGPTEREPS